MLLLIDGGSSMSKKKRSKEMFTEEQVKEFAKRLNEAIENSPYKNNVEVAKAARTFEANISRWRRGEAMPELINILRLSEALSVPVDNLVGRKIESKSDISEVKHLISEMKAEMQLLRKQLNFPETGGSAPVAKKPQSKRTN